MSQEAKLRYVILYVESLDRALEFYSRAMGFEQKARHGSYAEVDTGATILAFAERDFIREHLGIDVAPAGQDTCEIGIVVDREQVDAVFGKALAAGAIRVKDPADQPWGQRTSYVRDPDRHLVEICSPVG